MDNIIIGRYNQWINDRYLGVLLAAGRSQRMGVPKAFLPFRDGMNFLEACLQAFNNFGCKEVVVVVNQQLFKQVDSKEFNLQENARFVCNEYPERGRFFSLQCGLKALTKRTNTFIHNVDNPFITSGVLQALAEKEKTADVICPAYGARRGHPVLVSSGVVKDIISEDSHDYNLRDYLERYQHVSVPVTDPNILVNINTPEDYARMVGGICG